VVLVGGVVQSAIPGTGGGPELLDELASTLPEDEVTTDVPELLMLDAVVLVAPLDGVTTDPLLLGSGPGDELPSDGPELPPPLDGMAPDPLMPESGPRDELSTSGPELLPLLDGVAPDPLTPESGPRDELPAEGPELETGVLVAPLEAAPSDEETSAELAVTEPLLDELDDVPPGGRGQATRRPVLSTNVSAWWVLGFMETPTQLATNALPHAVVTWTAN